MRRGQSVTIKNFKLNESVWTQPELRSRFVVRCGISAGCFEQQNPGSPGFLLRGAFVPMVQATESWLRKNVTSSHGRNSATGCLLLQSQMRAVVVVIAHVIGEQFVQVSFVDSDNVVEQITAAASHPAVGHSVLPGTPDRGSHAGDLHRAKGSQYFQAVLLIVIADQEFWG